MLGILCKSIIVPNNSNSSCKHSLAFFRFVWILSFYSQFLPPLQPAPKFNGERGMDISDIEGTKSTRAKRYLNRPTNNIVDIEGAAPNWKQKQFARRNAPRNFGNISDIMVQKKKFIHDTDPLNPVHKINGMTIRNEDRGTKPRASKKRRNGPNFYTTQDIEGANSHFLAKKVCPFDQAGPQRHL